MSLQPNMSRAFFVIQTERMGKGVVATRDIRAGESLIDFSDGERYNVKTAMDLPTPEIRDHAIQVAECCWIDTPSPARFFNHSCDPNCGINELTKIVAMRDIRKGEELTFDYEMTEDSNWRMQCNCGSPKCRGTIGSFANMPDEVRKRYQGYLSRWLVDKYGLDGRPAYVPALLPPNPDQERRV